MCVAASAGLYHPGRLCPSLRRLQWLARRLPRTSVVQATVTLTRRPGRNTHVPQGAAVRALVGHRLHPTGRLGGPATPPRALHSVAQALKPCSASPALTRTSLVLAAMRASPASRCRSALDSDSDAVRLREPAGRLTQPPPLQPMPAQPEPSVSASGSVAGTWRRLNVCLRPPLMESVSL
jgi:hypothetical protein